MEIQIQKQEVVLFLAVYGTSDGDVQLGMCLILEKKSQLKKSQA